jgi:hypothetical protein
MNPVIPVDRRHRAASQRPARGHFDRERLPDPAHYYGRELPSLHGRGVWRDALCPFHEDSRPSLRVNVQTGGFVCFACGAKGGDVLSFHMRKHGLSFVDACKALGAWVEEGRRHG